MIIRKAETKDLPELTAIYNYEIINGVATLDINPKNIHDMELWLNAHNKQNHPLLIAEIDGKAAGYASLSSYREKEAYSSTVELSVYISHRHRGAGLATALMNKILELAKNDSSTHLVVSVITRGNAASERLHKRFGFSYCGTIHEAGVKFGKYLDIDNYELRV